MLWASDGSRLTALRPSCMIWDLQIGYAIHSCLWILAERRREDSYKSWLRIETVQTSKWLKWKAMHFVAYRKLSNDTSATINGLPKDFLSLGVERKIVDDDDWINLSFSPLLPPLWSRLWDSETQGCWLIFFFMEIVFNLRCDITTKNQTVYFMIILLRYRK